MREGGLGTTSEESLNDKLAELLRSYGLEAEAEQRIRGAPGGTRRWHKLDVVAELDNECVALEAELGEAKTVKSDAMSRLPGSGGLLWRGWPITRAFAVTYPGGYGTRPESRAKQDLAATSRIGWQSVERDKNGEFVWSAEQRGSVRELAALLSSYWTQSASAATIDAVVAEASAAIDDAAARLANAPYLRQTHDDSDPAATCALVWLNALLFQELLAADLSPDVIPAPHTGKAIPKPRQDATPEETLADWSFILEINWYPIFELARQSLTQIPGVFSRDALGVLRRQAARMAHNRMIRRHDIAGRVFHRLLSSRKFLATNYTTIPAAVILAGLAFGSSEGPLTGKPLDDEKALAENLRVADPACGSGTLLMAALQEILNACRRARTAESGSADVDLKPVLERSLWGVDVVPGALHLTNTTLAMSETSQVLSGLNVYVMPHDVHETVARLGSLDFLPGAPNHGNTKQSQLFPPAGAASRLGGKGGKHTDLRIPETVDLFISNPPYTRAGGPGNAEHTAWNPLFGSVHNAKDKNTMQRALKETLQGTVGSLYAGLGSAFFALIDAKLKIGGMLAMVLPLTAATGSRWQKVREKLVDDYRIEWVVVSHDDRHRTKKKGFPGRLWISFSESTRIAEMLIIARRSPKPVLAERTRFANLRHNPDEPADAIALTRALLKHRCGNPVSGETELQSDDIACYRPGVDYGEIVTVPQSELNGRPWPYVAFSRAALTDAALKLRDSGRLNQSALPIVPLGDICALGPYHMQIKGKGGLFDIEETEPEPLDIPALWHHSSKRETTLSLKANAKLKRRSALEKKQGKTPNRQDGMAAEQEKLAAAQKEMLSSAGRLHLASELRHAPQRLAAAYTEQPMLGVSSWITLGFSGARPGQRKALCLWLNSTPGMLLRILHANRPYLGRSRLPHELARTLPVLDVTALTDAQLAEAVKLFGRLGHETLQGFALIATDRIRQNLNRCLAVDVLGLDRDIDYWDKLTEALAQEPLIYTRH